MTSLLLGSKVYHYTSEDGYEGMQRSGMIRPSTNTTMDAMMGVGVYLTHLPPTESSAKIISNNWDAGLEISRNYVNQFLDKVDVCLEFNSRDLPGLKKMRGGGRDVVMYPGAIDLNKVPHKVYLREEDDDEQQEQGGSCVIV